MLSKHQFGRLLIKKYPQKMNEPQKSASFWLRLLATLSELSIFLSFHLLFLMFLTTSSSLSQLILNIILYLIILVLSPLGLIYNILFTYFFGGSLGKLLTGLKIAGSEGSRLSFKRVLFRQTVGYQFSGILFGLGFWSILKDPQKLAWHDKASGSKVLVVKNFWALSVVLFLILTFINIYLISKTINNVSKNPLSEQVFSLIQSSIKEETATPSSQLKAY